MNCHFDTSWMHRQSCYSPNGFSKRVDYILSDYFIKRFSTNCRVFRRASVPFDSDDRLVALYCNFPCKASRKLMFAKTGKPTRQPIRNMKSLIENKNILASFS